MNTRGNLRLWIGDSPRSQGRFAEGHFVATTHESVGAFLRRGREASGESLVDVGRILRIRPEYLRAIEEDRLNDLPGSAYANGFVRAYASHLGADVPAVLDRLRDDLDSMRRTSTLRFPEPVAETRIPANAITAVCILLSLALYIIWYYDSASERTPPPFVTIAELDEPKEPPQPLRPFPDARPPSTLVAVAPATPPPEARVESDRIAHGMPMPRPRPVAGEPADGFPGAPASPTQLAHSNADAPTPVSYSAGGGTHTAAVDLAAELPVPELQPLPALSVRTGGSQGQAQAARIDGMPSHLRPVGAAPAHAAGIPADLRAGEAEVRSQQPRIVLEAHAQSWIEVRSRASGDVVEARLMGAGDSYEVPDRRDLVLTTGNAGGLGIVVGGRTAPSVGTSGEVVRGIALDPERLLAGTATRR